MEPSQPRPVVSVNRLVGDIMPMLDKKSAMKRDLLIAAVVTAAGALISGVSVAAIHGEKHPQMAQATPPLQSTPGHETKPSEPASTTGTSGARPLDTPPQPARPDADAQATGAKPALPPAPAEKTADPIPAK